jgi:hypothetical protein
VNTHGDRQGLFGNAKGKDCSFRHTDPSFTLDGPRLGHSQRNSTTHSWHHLALRLARPLSDLRKYPKALYSTSGPTSLTLSLTSSLTCFNHLLSHSDFHRSRLARNPCVTTKAVSVESVNHPRVNHRSPNVFFLPDNLPRVLIQGALPKASNYTFVILQAIPAHRSTLTV